MVLNAVFKVKLAVKLTVLYFLCNSYINSNIRLGK
jgi:hypothetical protein